MMLWSIMSRNQVLQQNSSLLNLKLGHGFSMKKTMIWFLNEAFYCKDKISEQFELVTSNWPKFTLSTSLTSNVVSILTWFPLGMPEEKHILIRSNMCGVNGSREVDRECALLFVGSLEAWLSALQLEQICNVLVDSFAFLLITLTRKGGL